MTPQSLSQSLSLCETTDIVLKVFMQILNLQPLLPGNFFSP